MEYGFDFELYEMVFKNCFIHSSTYPNGNLQLSLFGKDPVLDQTAHFADITLKQESKRLANDEIIVDCKYKPSLIPQLIKLGILKTQIGIYAKNLCLYPIYKIDLDKVMENKYQIHELVAA